MRVGSLFSGVGGFDLGLERAGHEIVWQVEKDAQARSVLRRHWPTATIHEDVTDVGSDELAPVDLVCGGFPCQDLSVAGKRAGLDGARSGLWYEFHRIVAELAPTWVLIENVPGLLSSNGGRDVAVIRRGLVDLGYVGAERVLDSQYFGVAQRRRRVFILACRDPGAGCPAEILALAEGVSGHPAPSREAGTGVAPLLEVGARTSGDGYRDGDGIGKAGDPMYSLQAGHQHGVAHALPTKYRRDPHEGTDTIVFGFNGDQSEKTRSMGETEDQSPTLRSGGTVHVAQAFKSSHYTRGKDGAPSDVAPPLSADADRGDQDTLIAAFTSESVHHDGVHHDGVHHPLRVQGAAAVYRKAQKAHDPDDCERWEEAEHSNTLNGQGDTAGTVALQSFVPRRLTPVECERLQGFPDDWTRYGVNDAGDRVELADSPRYRMMGNAVTVNVAEWIGRRVGKWA